MNKRMWGGRFEQEPDAVLEAINASIDFDRHLYAQDIAGSKAHASMLAKQGIIAADDAKKIAEGLDKILAEIAVSDPAAFTALVETAKKALPSDVNAPAA